MKFLKFIISIIAIIINIFIILITSILGLYGLCIVSNWDRYGIKTSLWFSEEKYEYSDGGWGDFTNYSIYYFNAKSIKKFQKNTKYKKVTQSDIENIKSYFENFEEWLEWCDFKDKYTFNKDTQIKEGDYFYIYALSGYDNYDLYYVDMEKYIVYFIHNNI